MQIGHRWKVTCSPLIIIPLVGYVGQPAGAQSVHRAKVQIAPGPTVQVSKSVPDTPHYENLAAGDPAHPGRLITCSMVFPNELGKFSHQNCYVSFDGGKSWELTLRIAEEGVDAFPTVADGLGDKVYAVAILGATWPGPADTLGFK